MNQDKTLPTERETPRQLRLLNRKNWFVFAIISFISMYKTCPLAAEPNHLSAQVDYLYWNPIQTNMTYAIVVKDTDFNNWYTLEQRTNWSSGFRLGATYGQCCWNTRFFWTHLHNSVTGSSNSPIIVANQFINSPQGFYIGGKGIGGPASSTWKLKFDTFDWDFSLILRLTKASIIRPLIGLRGGIIDQNEHIFYENFSNTITEIQANLTVDQINNFGGVGPKGGLSCSYCLGTGFNLIGNFSVAALFGELHSKTISETVNLSTDAVTDSHFHFNRNQIIPALELFIGMDWRAFTSCGFLISFGAGYEVQYFWNTWRTHDTNVQNTYIANGNFGDLIFQGLTLQFSAGW